MIISTTHPLQLWQRMVITSVLASVLSGIGLVWRGRTEMQSATAPINAVSHSFWPDTALHENDASFKYTGTGALVRFASSLLWSGLYDWLRSRRLQPSAANAVIDAGAITALAVVVDLKLVPQRLSPGFDERLSSGGIGAVYTMFAVGLAVGGLLSLRRS